MPIHLEGLAGQIASVVLLPGDPDRACMIADEYLESAVRYTARRGLTGFTGSWRGCPISVQASGMGGPSAAIVTEELAMLGAKVIIRIGTCGTLQQDVLAGSLVIANAACACDGASSQLASIAGFAPTASWRMTSLLADSARSHGLAFTVGTVASMDLFYDPRVGIVDGLRGLGVLALEMEAASVMTVCARHGLESAAIFAVTDTIQGQVRAEAGVITSAIASMIRVALDAAVELSQEGGRPC